MPAHCEANGLLCEETPEELQGLNWLELVLIQRYRPIQKIVELRDIGGRKTGVKATTGVMIVVPVPLESTISHVANTLPSDSHLQLFVTTRFGAEKIVRLPRVLKALNWLKQNNHFYKDIEINQQFSFDGDRVSFAKDVVNKDLNVLLSSDDGHLLTQENTEFQIVRHVNPPPVEGFAIDNYRLRSHLYMPISSDDNEVEPNAFPHLFPSGHYHLGDEREIKLNLSKYIHHQLRQANPKFCLDPNYLAFQYAKRMQTDLFNSMGTQARISRNTTKQDLMGILNDERFSASMNSMFEEMRGFGPYWNKRKLELRAHIEAFGSPTWFVTLNPAEQHWKDVLQIYQRFYPETTSENIREAIAKDSSHWCRYFRRRMNAFFSEVLFNDNGPLGKVLHYFWRVEYQHRGTQHIHCVLWTADRPSPDASPQEIAEFLDKYVTARMPDEKTETELYNIIKEHQLHWKRHSKTCLRTKKRRGRITQTCRFEFPRPVLGHTVVAGVSKNLAGLPGVSRKQYHLMRRECDTMVNDYNAELSLIWQANTDVQFIMGGITEVTDYVTDAKRNRQLRPADQLKVNTQMPAYVDNLVDTYYPNRPEALENFSLMTIALNFEVVAKSEAMKKGLNAVFLTSDELLEQLQQPKINANRGQSVYYGFKEVRFYGLSFRTLLVMSALFETSFVVFLCFFLHGGKNHRFFRPLKKLLRPTINEEDGELKEKGKVPVRTVDDESFERNLKSMSDEQLQIYDEIIGGIREQVQRGKALEFKVAQFDDTGETRELFRRVKLIIIDEISMCANWMLIKIHLRLQSIKGNQEVFGGVNIIALGDLMQLRPVNAGRVFEVVSSRQVAEIFGSIGPPLTLWWLFSYSELTTNMRQKKDKSFGEIMSRMRIEQLTADDVTMIKTRLINAIERGYEEPCTIEEAAEYYLKLLEKDPTAMALMPTNNDVIQFNDAVVEKLGMKTIVIVAEDVEEKSAIEGVLEGESGADRMTLKNAVISTRSMFCAGQAFVAFSRVRSLDGLHLMDFFSQKVYCDDEALKETNRLRLSVNLPVFEMPVRAAKKPTKLPPITALRKRKDVPDLVIRVGSPGNSPQKKESKKMAEGLTLFNESGTDCFVNSVVNLLHCSKQLTDKIVEMGIEAAADRDASIADDTEEPLLVSLKDILVRHTTSVARLRTKLHPDRRNHTGDVKEAYMDIFTLLPEQIQDLFRFTITTSVSCEGCRSNQAIVVTQRVVDRIEMFFSTAEVLKKNFKGILSPFRLLVLVGDNLLFHAKSEYLQTQNMLSSIST
ncbi:unnamed protein product [Caenorhabditis auriculariae]|uniref:ATP-dependent DNA helicase n=1 Tax=Caenorhabditis auriculariae TaxID=2777116 RepID=A0A8S1HW44_9PELO|nr:unnamed protein product [Caenorhabditis auriculariae]